MKWQISCFWCFWQEYPDKMYVDDGGKTWWRLCMTCHRDIWGEEMGHHFRPFLHGFLVFCSIFDQTMRKMSWTLGEIWWLSSNHRTTKTKGSKMIEKSAKNDIKKWKNSRFCISGISAHLAFLGSDFSLFFYSFLFHFYHFFFIFNHFSFFSISSWFFCCAAFSTNKWETCDEHLAKSDDNFQPIAENACKKIKKEIKNVRKKFETNEKQM